MERTALGGAAEPREREGSGRAGPSRVQGGRGGPGGVGRPKDEGERELAGGVRGLYEPVRRAGAGRRVMSGGEWGPSAPGDWAMPEGVQEFQGWWVGQTFEAGILPKSLFYRQCDAQYFERA